MAYGRFALQNESSWRNGSITFNDALIALDAEEQDQYELGLHQAEEFAEKEEQSQTLADLAKHYLNQVEAEICFLYLKQRRNKDISFILGIQEPEVARYKSSIVRKLKVYYKYKIEIEIKSFIPFICQVCELNLKQRAILKAFFEFRSLSYIGQQNGSKGSNMHRSLNTIKQRIQENVKKYPVLQIPLDFWKESRYVNSTNTKFTLIEELI